MPRLLLTTFLLPVVFAAPQAAPKITADKLTKDGPIIRAVGHVKAEVAGLILTGDKGSLNTDTDDVEVAGAAKVILPARSDRNLFRYPGGALVSGEAVVLTADSLSVRSALLLRARGKVKATTHGDDLTGSELDLFLRIGDGEIRGDVRLNGTVPERPSRRLRSDRFPPDIWKK